MTAPYLVIAQTTSSGPVVLGRYETEKEQRRQYALAVRCLAEGGFSDVTAIELASGEATDTQTVALENNWTAEQHALL